KSDEADVESGQGDDVVDAGALQRLLQIGTQRLTLPHQERGEEFPGAVARPGGGASERRRDAAPQLRKDRAPGRAGRVEALHQQGGLDGPGQPDASDGEVAGVVERSGIAESARPGQPRHGRKGVPLGPWDGAIVRPGKGEADALAWSRDEALFRTGR